MTALTIAMNGRYESTVFTNTQQIISQIFPELVLTFEQILTAR
jgi:Uma2 family endonuclease